MELAGEFDSRFTGHDIAKESPGRFRIDKENGVVDVVWLVYGKTSAMTGPMIAWLHAPVRQVRPKLTS